MASFTDLVGEIRGPSETGANLLTPDFLSIGSGSGGSGGSGGITTNIPVSSTPTTTTTTTTSSGSSWLQNLGNAINFLVNPSPAVGSWLLRLALFLLGLICIIGAIYLYKGSNPIMAVPAKALKGVVKAGTSAAKYAAQGEE